jgi:pimeloyl-ACP methyl ester carboxylesterase
VSSSTAEIRRPRERLDLDGLSLAYRVSGPPAAVPVVLLHGWGASIDAVAAVQDGLADEFRVVAFDLPGFGSSDLPPPDWGSPQYAELIARALARLGLERVSLIGHSFGGKVALLLASRQDGLPRRAVLVNSAGLRPRRTLSYHARVTAFKAARRLAGGGPLAGWVGQRLGSADYRSAGPLRQVFVRVVNEDLRSLLPRVACPTLLVWGDQDRETPPGDAAIMEREIPDAGLVVFPGAGHFSYADDLPRFLRVVRNFLKS